MSTEDVNIPIYLEQDLIVFNYIYELYLNGITITNYKKHLIKNSFEKFVLDNLEKEDFILTTSLYYLNYLILNDKIITNSSINYLQNKNKDLLAELYGDVLNILPLCSQIFLMMNMKNNTELNNKLFAIYKLCKNLYLLGQKICSLYKKDGDFLKEVKNGYIDLIKRQIKTDLESELLHIHKELKELKAHLLDKELDLFDVFLDIKKQLFSKYYKDMEKNKTTLIKISKKPFIYWKDNKTNIMSQLNLHFLEEFDSFEKELQELKDIENISTSLIFFLEYEEYFWKQKAYNTLALKFFMDKDDLMKYSYITKNEDELKDFLKRYYNYTSLESFSFTKNIQNLIEDISKNNRDLTIVLKDLNRKLPSFVVDNNFIIATNENEDLINALSLKIYKIFSESLK